MTLYLLAPSINVLQSFFANYVMGAASASDVMMMTLTIFPTDI